jgi:hypothetical protein
VCSNVGGGLNSTGQLSSTGGVSINIRLPQKFCPIIRPCISLAVTTDSASVNIHVF